ncbi:EpsD family peptidyl-prolyl cis-trans isomerase [Thauera sinica]|uniref:EpsD family peptidyl-prolyl cis-trans isomerase n=1 Tax=Thauera sinica TaxID=2665146 RepID=A0ABW1ANJ7_9RHOO|nr:EpsD family peptidyl-prolyl cis-trans isomerase [Thauera sp. K11]ATE60542.1 peptidyl-prolyl cis-trans isomerase, EpsD family [Thauera sp. K11]
MLRFSRPAPLIALAVAAVLAGCGGDSDKKPASQVAAKVNKGEISVHQINGMLASAGNIPAAQVKQAGAAALERLIDQELLVQKANDRKLDRDPKVMQSIEAARREILARAYLEQVTGQSLRPTDNEISTFYAENPALFSQRRIYNLQEMSIRIPAERFDELQNKLRETGNAQQLVAWLNEQKLPFNVNNAVRPAEQLPMEGLKGFAQMKDGQAMLTRTATGASLVVLAASRSQPLDEAAARPFIEQYLSNQKKAELARTELKHLRGTAEIEYVGEFAQTAPKVAEAAAGQKAADGAPAAATPPEASAPAANPPAVSAPAGEAADPLRSVLEKGAAGLK